MCIISKQAQLLKTFIWPEYHLDQIGNFLDFILLYAGKIQSNLLFLLHI